MPIWPRIVAINPEQRAAQRSLDNTRRLAALERGKASAAQRAFNQGASQLAIGAPRTTVATVDLNLPDISVGSATAYTVMFWWSLRMDVSSTATAKVYLNYGAISKLLATGLTTTPSVVHQFTPAVNVHDLSGGTGTFTDQTLPMYLPVTSFAAGGAVTFNLQTEKDGGAGTYDITAPQLWVAVV